MQYLQLFVCCNKKQLQVFVFFILGEMSCIRLHSSNFRIRTKSLSPDLAERLELLSFWLIFFGHQALCLRRAVAPLLAVCARIWKEWIPWLHQISVLYGAQVSSICLPSKDGLLTQHSRCNVGWVQKCKYTHIERTLSPEHTYWLAHTADADRQRHTWKRTHLFYKYAPTVMSSSLLL